jgi:dCTP diphosphatase
MTVRAMSGDDEVTIQQLKDRARKFTNDRDWEQFHHPKDLAMAISMEAAELMEPFLWKERDVEAVRRDPELMARVEEELADVLILSFCLANTLGIDVGDAYDRKMGQNAQK